LIVSEGIPEGRRETTGGFVKKVGFEPAVKRVRELWMRRVVNQNRKQ